MTGKYRVHTHIVLLFSQSVCCRHSLSIDYIPYHIHITNSTQEYAYIQDLQPEKSKWGPPLPDAD